MRKHRYTWESVRKGLPTILMSVLLAFHPGCGTWIGNPPGATDSGGQDHLGTVALSITASAPAAALTAYTLPIMGKSGSPIGTLTLNEAKISIEEIRLKLDADDQEDREKFNGPYVADLVSNTVTPSLETIRIPAGDYKELSFRIHKLEKGEVGGYNEQSPLINQSIYLTGTYTPLNGDPIKITMTEEVDEEFSLANPDSASPGIKILEGGSNSVAIAFRLSKWFDFTGLEYDFADLGARDSVLGKDGSEVEKKLRELIKENIKRSADFGNDDDHDGEPDEDADH